MEKSNGARGGQSVSKRRRGQRGEPHAPRRTETRPEETGGGLSRGDPVDDEQRDSDEPKAEREPKGKTKDKERIKIPILA